MPSKRKDEIDWGAVAAGVIIGAIGIGVASALLTKKCPYCGTRLSKAAQTCSHCGNYVGGVR